MTTTAKWTVTNEFYSVDVLNTHKGLYTNCPDFSLLYRFLLDKRDHGTAETLVPRPDRTASTDDRPQATALPRTTKKRKGGEHKHRTKKLPAPNPKMTRQHKCADGFVIDMSKLTALFDLKKFMVNQTTDLLNFINTNDFETLCVPNVKR